VPQGACTTSGTLRLGDVHFVAHRHLHFMQHVLLCTSTAGTNRVQFILRLDVAHRPRPQAISLQDSAPIRT
jgi:hypothetical protein